MLQLNNASNNITLMFDTLGNNHAMGKINQLGKSWQHTAGTYDIVTP